MTLVRSSAPPGGTAGWTATLTKTPLSYSALQRSAAFQSSPTTHRDDRCDDLAAVGESSARAAHGSRARSGRDGDSGRCREPSRTARGPSAERQIRTAASVAPTAAGTAAAVKMNGARRSAGTRSRPWGRRSRRRTKRATWRRSPSADRRGPRPRTARTVPAPRAPSTPERVGLVDHQPGAEAVAQLGDLDQRCDVALHRVDAVDDDQHAAPVVLRSLAAASRASRGGCA